MTKIVKIISIQNNLADRSGKAYTSFDGSKRMKQEITYELDGAQKRASCFSGVDNPLFKPEMQGQTVQVEISTVQKGQMTYYNIKPSDGTSQEQTQQPEQKPGDGIFNVTAEEYTADMGALLEAANKQREQLTEINNQLNRMETHLNLTLKALNMSQEKDEEPADQNNMQDDVAEGDFDAM